MRKTDFPRGSSSRETTWIRFGKAGAHPQLALGIAIAPETLSLITTSWFQKQLRFFPFSPRFYLQILVQFYLLRKCGLLAHTSPAFLKNCWIKKLFSCLRLVIETPYSWKTNCVWFGRIASLSAFVLFAGVCVVRIAYEFFLDCSLQEFFMFLEWRTAFVYFS